MFANPFNLGSTINSSVIDGAPTLSADGLILYFHSDRSGGTGNFDLYMATRASTSSAWNPATNLGATLNSGFDDRAPAISPDGLSLMFTSDRTGNGDRDLYIYSRASTSDAWGTASLFSPTFEIAGEGGPEFSADGLTLFYHSDRNNGNTNLRSLSRASVSSP